jgi:hypothetical protein
MLVKVVNIQFHENPSSGSQVVTRTDMDREDDQANWRIFATSRWEHTNSTTKTT